MCLFRFRPFIMLKKTMLKGLILRQIYLTAALCSSVMSSPANCLRLPRLTCYFLLQTCGQSLAGSFCRKQKLRGLNMQIFVF